MSICLAIDTSLFGLNAAISDLGSETPELLGEVWEPEHRKVTAALPDMVSELCRQANLSLSDIHAVVVSSGPGSFTGIRVGLGFVYGLLAGQPHLQVIGISALGALAKRLWYRRAPEPLEMYLAATRNTGYRVYVDDAGEVSITAINVESDHLMRKQGALKSQVMLAGEWPLLKDYFSIKNQQVASSELGDLCRDIRYAMVDEARTGWPERFNRLLPTASYYKRSVPEEKIHGAITPNI